MAVFCTNMTWNAYNNFGGRSNYINQRELLPTPTVSSRGELERYTKPGTWPFDGFGAPLSFDRPEPGSFVPEDAKITDSIEGRLACFNAPGETASGRSGANGKLSRRRNRVSENTGKSRRSLAKLFTSFSVSS